MVADLLLQKRIAKLHLINNSIAKGFVKYEYKLVINYFHPKQKCSPFSTSFSFFLFIAVVFSNCPQKVTPLFFMQV